MTTVAALCPCVASGCASGYGTLPEPDPAEIPALEAQRARRPTAMPVLTQLGAAYRAADRPQDAIRTLEYARGVDSTAATPVVLLGLAYEDVGRLADARDLYGRYLALVPDSRLRERLEGRIEIVRRREFEVLVQEALAREAELTDVPATTTLAVFPFEYAGDDAELEPLGHALAGMVTTDLSRAGRFTVLERTHLNALLQELALSRTDLINPSTASRSGRLLGAGRVIQGRIGGSAADVSLDAAVVELTASDPSIAPVGRRDALDRLFDMEKALVLDLFDAMGVTLTASERERVLQRRTDDLQALLAYGRGLEAAQRGDYRAAARAFRRATQLDPSFGEARQEAEDAERAAAGSDVTTAELGREAFRDVEIPELLRPVEVVERNVFRDPIQEVMGTEGVSVRPTVIEIHIRRPGGGR